MPPAPAVRHRVSRTYTLPTDSAFMAQVNVDASGMNIRGDAANEPSMAIDPAAPNRMVIVWRQFDSVLSTFRQAGYAWSNDGGRTWHFPGVLTPGTFRSDPVVESDAQGNFYYYSLTDPTVSGWHCALFRSIDGGRTWSPPLVANGGDRCWLAIDKTGGIGSGNIYADWDATAGCCGSANFGRDTSGGAAPWPAPVAAPANPGLSTIAVGPDGEVYFAGAAGTSIRVMRSDNARERAQVPSFSLNSLVQVNATVLPQFPGNNGGTTGQVWVDLNRSAGPARGHVYLLTAAGPFGVDPCDLVFLRSTDGGHTWSAPVRVNDDPPSATAWQWFPTLSVAPGGRIDATWYDTRNGATVYRSQMLYAYSLDEGATWSTNMALTPSFDTTAGWPQPNKLGDYYDQESDDVGVSVAFAATFDGEQNIYFMRINDWDCNRNGVPDATDLALGLLHDCNRNGIPDECERAAGVEVNCPCVANCDGSTTPPILNINDFVCFQGAFAAGSSLANCDHSTAVPVLNVADFICFQSAFAAGCR